LRYGENILGADAALDYKEVFSEYICKGQRAGNDEDFGAAVAEESASLSDTTVRRRRVMLIKASGQTDGGSAADRVKYERASRRAKAIATTYTVQGWRQADGSLWRHNELVRVTGPVIGFDDQFVIAQVTYRLNEQGMVCVLQVGPPDGYVNNPAKVNAKKDAAKKRAAGGDGSGEWGDVRPADSKAPKVNNKPVKSSGGWDEVKRAR
jgi:prophage tail gpP-like protein